MADEGSLLHWDDISEVRWDGLLIGNGASMAVWGEFGYRSLFETACSGDIEHQLSGADQSLFNTFRTQNFEQILGSLVTARHVSSALGSDTSIIDDRHKSIQSALMSAIHHVHVP